jgi:hypothetical protein
VNGADNRTEMRWRRGMAGGAVAGIVGGIVLAAWMMIDGAIRGRDFWVGMKGAAYPFLGERVMQPGFDAAAVVLGEICHFAVSIGWGMLFGLIAYGLSRRATVAFGALWGLVVWLGMDFVVLPLLGLGALARGTPLAVAVLTHVVFGLVVGLAFLPYQHTLPHHPRRWHRREVPT